MSEIMSYSLKYYPDPGIAFDISKMLFVKLNPVSVWKSSLTSIDSPVNEFDFIHDFANFLPHPESDLLLYVFIPSNKNTTFLSTLIAKLMSQDFYQFTISKLTSYIKNDTSFQHELISYYLGNTDYKLSNLETKIRTSKTIPDKIKVLLLGFIISPTQYQKSLAAFISLYYDLIKSNCCPDNPLDLLPKSVVDIIMQTYPDNRKDTIQLNCDELGFSFSFSTLDFLVRNFTSDKPYFICAPDTFTQIKSDIVSLDTNVFIETTSAISDKHRLSIISHLINQKHMTLQQLSNEIDLSLSTTYHHLDQLKKVNIVNSSRHGRSVYYSYNPTGFKNIIYSIQHIEKGGIPK